ncbi:class I SAM-dependent rRNA methyltransferase [Prevotella communis]|jgi:23S rRNA (cytosine1962-C5)-methyltransferase|uniref:23S rRNA (Cytosine1962-C5)-methyltransferase n=1 Tax=Prevotella communis TaxID=2913614 RepID=A0A1H0JSV3_9BACT|nr:class I SAM-dependent rRNA methyltransferase [Prevotella communis]MCR5473209.1 class I SAM-dependent rRNA methyltransferase [Prevotella sp.]UKK58010.1 class I SAM-dependent rRNA methyltransferase [Prevotella communis]UKK60678.1 class I SAM-dependent rRNA methyltransferase [Prevotella communis]UKK63494.1 class I SAM-dependent rRNA methyltransferase [Prevotella communis]UKK66320.1 class I SAM-dependent rRNA methyltransferase [Prevotella communis]
MKQVYLKRGKEESLLRFHPWVFSGAIHHLDDGIEEGDVVRVVSEKGVFIAVGHYQQGSISVRVLTFNDVEIDDAFWHSRIQSALNMRQDIGLANSSNTNAFRLVHGEGDLLPGLIIDVYDKTAVMQAHSIGMHMSRHAIAKALAEVMKGRIENIYYKSETTLPFMEPENGFLLGNSDDNIAIENGLRFYVDWLRGQKTGFFVDQRENRALLEKYAKGKRVLNMFCYTGGFSFYAMRGGAQLVHSVDSSAKAIELTRRNVELNFPGDPRHEAFCEDAFKYLDSSSHTYDLIILDPPAFAKHRGALHNALKGYTRLNEKAFEKIEKGGILFTFSCSQVVSKDHFRNAVFTAAAQAKRKVRILHQLHQPADHPINIYHPEGEYLKGLVLYVE